MRELSVFVDESGSDGLSDRHYLLTVVMHDQSESIADSITAYEGALRAKGPPDIPFHAPPKRTILLSPSISMIKSQASWQFDGYANRN